MDSTASPERTRALCTVLQTRMPRNEPVGCDEGVDGLGSVEVKGATTDSSVDGAGQSVSLLR